MRLLPALVWAAVTIALVTTEDVRVLTPSITSTISHNKPILATSTCGEVNGQSIKEIYCSLAGSAQYSPFSQYSYKDDASQNSNLFQELRNTREALSLGGHGCDHCEAGTDGAHPAKNMVDGNTSWWQSPPLSRGMQYNQVNITIDLEQEYLVAYVYISMANSPKPSTWILERSSDHGKSYQPWLYFAANGADCMRRFGEASLTPILEDDSVICRTDMGSIHPLENAEMVINLMENRPNRERFHESEKLQEFVKATNVRIRLLSVRTFQGHLMDLNDRSDPTVTRRYFYAIKEILIGGRCVCNGHASTCDILDPKRPRAHLCRCEHNTCGDMCDKCCPGYEQKKWQPTTVRNNFTCEPCNCFGRSTECTYEEQLDLDNKSLDIHGNYEGGGRCLNCRDNTEGINCNKCVFGFFKPEGVSWADASPCKACQCNPDKHTGDCRDDDGKCECQERFEGEDCDKCAKGYYDEPECKKCECAVDGTVGEVCLPVDGQCPCKEGFGGTFCETCAAGFTNFTAGCEGCVCNDIGSENSICSAETGQCVCKSAFSGLHCDQCQLGYFGFPNCTYCNCDPKGTEDGQCDSLSGQCLCKEGFVGEKCDQCDTGYYGYPNCKVCNCDGAGARTPECDLTSGQCPCYSNFTGRICDKCAAGFYDYPNCKACSCLIEGAKGLTCDNQGQCYCKGNFEGERCDRCKPNFYNFPACEECNCNPDGVTPGFAGCDKVAPGELCECRKHVSGRICDQCKPTFWDLRYQHTDGCIGCDCNTNGTLSRLNSCDLKSGQCACKANAGGRQCEKCAYGFYNLQAYSQHGCEPCDCDIGGALRADCDLSSGQCRCRPRVTGLRCDKPIDNHYFPNLWHNQYEAEDGHTPDNRPVRYAVDQEQFRNFSWRGYAVFSPIQEKIFLEMDILKSSVYRLLFKYHNPTLVPITAQVTVTPRQANSHDQEQTEKIVFAQTTDPTIKEITLNGKPFVMNPGRWALGVETKQRLFLDYVVVLPAEYYEATALKQRDSAPCEAHALPNTTCVDLLYPPLPTAARADVDEGKTDTFRYVNIDGTTQTIGKVPIDIVPADVGPAVLVQAGNDSKVVEAQVDVPADGEYALVIEYHNSAKKVLPILIDVSQDGESKLNGSMVIHHCPFATFCRELVTEKGVAAYVPLKEGQANVQMFIDPNNQFGLSAINLVRKDEWKIEYLKQVPVCVRRNGKCLSQEYPPAPNAIVAEAESGANSDMALSGDKLPFPIANPSDVKVTPLDDTQSTLEIAGVVPTKGHHMFLVHYFNPDNTPLELSGLLQYNDHYSQGNCKYTFKQVTIPLAYCPSVSGCRALIREQLRPELIQFYVEDKYTATFYHNNSQKGPVYINSVTAVPFHSYSESLMTPLPIDLSAEFIEQCGKEFFKNDCSPNGENGTCRFCKEKIFSLVTDFNAAAFSCDCTAKGSESFACEEYGGQCKCKANIIGRRCERCAPGYYNYPECIKCKCGSGQQCDEVTGQCFCPPHVEGTTCDRCIGYAFGYDPLIGCQLCGCHSDGSDGGALQCDADSGQCLCRESVGGRKCDRCLAGSYGFPHCYPCRCNQAGTTEDVCNATNAQCMCKQNTMGGDCGVCKSGTFDLSAENPLGCADCFCFGVTDQCRSSMYPVLINTVDMSAFTATDPAGSVTHEEIVTYSAGDQKPKDAVYFNVPINVGADYTPSYGLMLSFQLIVTPSGEQRRMTTDADVRLIGGNNITAEYWASEQPANPEEEFTVKCRLVPENFISSSGKPLTREDLMMLLQSLKNISLKASYFAETEKADLIEFSMETTTSDYRADSAMRASSVEQCQCPAPYQGPSCQQCASGFYRVEGNFLGACVPCECNGHSGSCDPDTGVCFECEHNTHGDHCEFCDEGHYGDSTTGTPFSCLACQCPFAPENNFASSCQVSDYGELQSCNCKPGYSGERCDRCAAGFYGEPNRIGGSCQPCDCNGNNNLTDSRACHPVTGDCYLCEKNTHGRHCEWCAPWFHGDAVSQKNCSECSCNQCGSQRCDNTLGFCDCKPNVVGYECDRCAPDHWGYSKCRGCEACHCSEASSGGQCHLENGQCPCRPGAAGMRCEHCEHGYWNYGPHGCQKCDCEADLSLGTVCDVRTGQCHCQEGATGPRCDQCERSYLRIPTMGCRRCDECVHSLIEDVNLLDIYVGDLKHSISNISTSTVVGARLNKAERQLNELNDLSKLLTNSDNEYNNLVGDTKNVLNANAAIFNTANRTYRVSLDGVEKTNNLTIDAEDIAQDIQDRAEYARTVVDSLRSLTLSIGSQSSAFSIDPRWLEEAEAILMDLEATSADSSPEKSVSVPKKLAEVTEKLDEFKEKIQIHKDKLETAKTKMDNISGYLADTQKLLKQSKKDSEKTLKMSRDQSMFKLEGLYKAITDDIDKLGEEKRKTDEILFAANNQTESARDLRESISNGLVNLNETRAEVSEALEARKRVKRGDEKIDGDLAALKTKSKELSEEAARLKGTFGSTQLESQNAVEAATAYSNLTDALVNADTKAKETIELVAAEKEGLDDLTARVGTTLETSKSQTATVVDLQKNELQKLVDESAAVDAQVDEMTEKVDSMRRYKTQIHENMKSPLKENNFEDIEKKVEHVNSLKEDLEKNLEANKEQISEIKAKADEAVAKQTDAIQGTKTAKSNIKELSTLAPAVAESYNKLKTLTGSKTVKIDSAQEKVDKIKEMIAVARDAANRIRLGARFQRGSSLDLNIPHRVSRHAARTDLSFYFRTPSDHGIPLFFGNEHGSAGSRAVPTDDYLAVEIEYGQPKVTIDLGEEPLVVKMDTRVSDNQWRRIDVERIGKSATVKISVPNGEEVAETKKMTSDGNKSVLNLHQTISKLYVGGVPSGTKLAQDVRNRDFEGDIEELVLLGEPVGLWNAKQGGMVNVQGAKKRPRTNDGSDNGVSLNGEGYIVHELGHWNPRKRTVFSLDFLTYSPDGLLFFIGKDREFLTVELSSGAVRLSLDFGSGVGEWSSSRSNYNDGKWHTVAISREGTRVKMDVDGDTVAEGDSPGAEAEMSVTGAFYLGGTPAGINTRSPVEPLHGCLKSIRLNSDEMDLQGRGVKASKGVRNACPLGEVSTVTILSDRSSAVFTNVSSADEIDVTLRFKTREQSGVIFYIRSEDDEDVLSLAVNSGELQVQAGDDKLILELTSASDEQWHFVSVRKTKEMMRLDVDDLHSKQSDRANVESTIEIKGNEPADERFSIIFGRPAHSSNGAHLPSFIGCVGDVTYNGQVLDFSKVPEIKEVSLTGCSLRDDLVKTTVSPVVVLPTSEPEEETETKEVALKPSSVPEEASTTVEAIVLPPETTVPPTETPEPPAVVIPTEPETPEPAGIVLETEAPASTESTVPTDLVPEMPEASMLVLSTAVSETTQEVLTTPTARPDGACALPLEPRGELENSEGVRFGSQPHSRIEYVLAESYDKSSTFSMTVRPSASSGVLLFAANEKHTDHIGLFISDGRIVFSFDCGNGQVMVKSKKSILDGEWHAIKATRHGAEAHLVVDDESFDISAPNATDNIDTQAPLYIGGIPADVAGYAKQLVPGVKSEFGGCMKDWKLNEKPLDDTNKKELGTEKCSEFEEKGMYFGSKGGYAILKKEYNVGQTFSAEIEVRPRVPSAILLSVGKVEYLTVQLINGTVEFTVESGAGPETLTYTPGAGNAFCDGHWHSIKIMKKKNLLTLTVDGKSFLHVMKKSRKSETVTKDPIYLAGVPEGSGNNGLKTQENFVGCIRIVNYGDKKSRVLRRKIRQLDVMNMETFGDVNKMACPVN